MPGLVTHRHVEGSPENSIFPLFLIKNRICSKWRREKLCFQVR